MNPHTIVAQAITDRWALGDPDIIAAHVLDQLETQGYTLMRSSEHHAVTADGQIIPLDGTWPQEQT